MNIFYLHENPYKAAEYQYNQHVVKMILESAQMLCTAHHYYGNGDNVPYKAAHINHPSTIWVRENMLHYRWLYNHMLALGLQYTERYGKQHLAIHKCKEACMWAPNGIPTLPFKQPPQAMPDEYKHEDSIIAYWQYYINDKSHIAAKTENKYERIPIFN